MSMPVSLASNGILPIACVASQWNRAPCPWASLAASLTGLITPVSLFAAITETTLYILRSRSMLGVVLHGVAYFCA